MPFAFTTSYNSAYFLRPDETAASIGPAPVGLCGDDGYLQPESLNFFPSTCFHLDGEPLITRQTIVIARVLAPESVSGSAGLAPRPEKALCRFPLLDE